MPVTETDVAITERLCPSQPFRAVLKQVVDDFIVNEISQENTVLRVTILPRHASKRPHPITPSPTTVPFSQVDAFFPASDTPPSVALSAAVSEGKPSYSFPVLNDKKSRTALHLWVREYLPSFIGDTLQTDEGQIVRIRSRSQTKPWKRRRKDRSNSNNRNLDAVRENTYDPREHHEQYEGSFPRNSLVNFVLWKRNRDTTEALTMLANVLSRNVKHFSYAGTKDKRAVTTQLVQVRGVQERDLARANSRLLHQDRNRASVLVGNVSPANKSKSLQLRLGDLNGNRFTIVLRDVERNCDESIQTAIKSVCQVGFINYFGLQRFGSGVSPTHVTGFAVLRGDYKEVCRRILLPLRIGEDDAKMNPGRRRFVQAMEQFARDEITASDLLSQLARWQRIERAVVESFADDEKRGVPVPDYRKAFARLPRFLRMMYGHAVQSYIWNVMASERIRLNKPGVADNRHAVEGDLVTENEADESDLSFKSKVREVTNEEEKNKSISVHRVLIPVLGSEVDLPSASYAKKAKEIMEAEKIDFKTHSRSEYQLKGTYRRLLTVPKDFEWKFVPYNDKHDIIVPSEVESLLAQLRKTKERSSRLNQSRNHDEMTVSDEKLSSDAKAMKNGESDVQQVKSQAENGTDLSIEVSLDNGSNSNIQRNEDHANANDTCYEYQKGNEKTAKESREEPIAKEPNSIEESMEDATGPRDEEDVGLLSHTEKKIDRDERAEVIRATKGNVHESNNAEAKDDVKKIESQQTKETIAGEIVVEVEKTKQIGVVPTADADINGQSNLNGENSSKNAVDDDSYISRAPGASVTGGNEKNAAHERQNKKSCHVLEKSADYKGDGQSVFLEDTGACHDKKMETNNVAILSQRESDTKEGPGNSDANLGEQHNSGSQTVGDRNESRRALVISFNLGCAEYATMLVRELTGFESSTATQKALQEGLEQVP